MSKQEMMSKTRQGRHATFLGGALRDDTKNGCVADYIACFPRENPYFWGLPSYKQRLTFTRKKLAVLRTTRNSVLFLFDVTNLHGSLLRDYWRETILFFDVT